MRAAAGTFAITLLLWAVPGLADPPEAPRFDLEKSFALGIAEHRLDEDTELTGWRLNGSWYFGHEDGGETDGLALVWEGDHEHLSISTDGIRFVRRF